MVILRYLISYCIAMKNENKFDLNELCQSFKEVTSIIVQSER